MENATIKQSLFPPPGPNPSTVKGGGTPKNVAQFQLCKLLLGKDEKYKDALAQAEGNPKERASWSTKIKNRLRTMSQITRGYIVEMGETGAGIQSVAEIDMNVRNSFTNKWGAYLRLNSPLPALTTMHPPAEISKACPWFFDMRNLIAQRPNLIPTGIGNSTTTMDAALILPSPVPPAGPDSVVDVEDTTSDTSVPLDGWNTTPSPHHSPDPEGSTVGQKRSIEQVEDDGAGSGDDYELSSPGVSGTALVDDAEDEEKEDKEEDAKDEGKPDAKPERKFRPAKAGSSTPAAPAPVVAPKPSKKSKVAEFSEIAKSEEKSRQKEIELATLPDAPCDKGH
ncbi:hypothetical protein MSAN_00501600 [Mycena sanguinolenta]|uniref:Uncharacterized protein n=1 Tax=Mycena sanguinolenta TaxID=230812 RepID=A0A8H6Z9S1_9AGAR|nr:hypothetical protein MSAN_00501600 [Mycena sanguinolenta]